MVASLALALTISLLAGVQQAPPALHGTWMATVGQKRTFRGTWSAAIQSTTRNAAQGSWMLHDNANRVVLEGTWSAQRSPKGWLGTWSARIAPGSAAGRTPPGRSFSGTWQASIENTAVTDLAEMLEHARQDQIGGSWRRGRLQGHWWLKGPPR